MVVIPMVAEQRIDGVNGECLDCMMSGIRWTGHVAGVEGKEKC